MVESNYKKNERTIFDEKIKNKVNSNLFIVVVVDSVGKDIGNSGGIKVGRGKQDEPKEYSPEGLVFFIDENAVCEYE